MMRSLVLPLALLACSLAATGCDAYGRQEKKGSLSTKQDFLGRMADVVEHWKSEYVLDLGEFITIPTVASDIKLKKQVDDIARWASGRLEHGKMEWGKTKVIKLEGVDARPFVYAEKCQAKDKPTVLIYGHFDAKEMPTAGRWKDPFVIKEVHESWWARGIAAGKGLMLTAIQGVEIVARTNQDFSYDKEDASLPINLKWILEGEGEIGSPNLKQMLEENKELFKDVDVIISTVGSHDTAGVPKVPASTVNDLAASVWEEEFGTPMKNNRDPKGRPALVTLQEVLGAPLTVFGNAGANPHQSNEKLKYVDFDKARNAWAKLILGLGRGSVANKVLAESAERRGDKSEL